MSTRLKLAGARLLLKGGLLKGGAAFSRPRGDVGMSLRDHFAGQAMQGMLADGTIHEWEVLTECSYAAADAMLAAREKKV